RSKDQDAPDAAPSAEAAPGFRERLALRRRLLLRRLREHLEYDSFLFKKLAALAGVLLGFRLLACGRRRRAFPVWAAVPRRAYARLADRVIERRFRAADALRAAGREHVGRLSATPATARFVEDPGWLLGTRALVLKPPGPDERGCSCSITPSRSP